MPRLSKSMWTAEEIRDHKKALRRIYYEKNRDKILQRARERRTVKSNERLRRQRFARYPNAVVAPPVSDDVMSRALSARLGRKLTAYNIYVKDNYRLVKARNPTSPPKEIMRLLGQQWRSYKGSGFFF